MSVQKELTKKHKSSQGVGYKVFVTVRDSPYGEFFHCHCQYPVGKWLTSHGGPGFHVFTSLKSAKIWVDGNGQLEIRKIHYENATAIGHQYYKGQYLRCVTAKNIKIGSRIYPKTKVSGVTTRIKVAK